MNTDFIFAVPYPIVKVQVSKIPKTYADKPNITIEAFPIPFKTKIAPTMIMYNTVRIEQQ